MYKYSIIIPVYNAEKFIEKAVKSILSQSYGDFEIILVNDGSSDSSSEICHAFEKNDPQRIKVIDHENQGTSGARNTGLENATGDYIGFMDNDDFWISNDVLYNIDQRLSKSNADAIVFPIAYLNDGTGIMKTESPKIIREEFSSRDFFGKCDMLFANGLISCMVWSKFVKREIVFKEPYLLFPRNMRNEDTDWIAKLLFRINSIDYYEKPVYVYLKFNAYSQTSKPIKLSHLLDLEKILEDNIIRAEKEDERRKALIFSFLSYPYSVWLGQTGLINDRKAHLSKLGKYSYLLKYSKSLSGKALYIFCRIFGLWLTSEALLIILKIKYPFLKKNA